MTNEQEPRVTFDPSKLTIDNDGKVVITDPAFMEALRTAVKKEGEGPDLGTTVAIVHAL